LQNLANGEWGCARGHGTGWKKKSTSSIAWSSLKKRLKREIDLSAQVVAITVLGTSAHLAEQKPDYEKEGKDGWTGSGTEK